MQCQWRPQKYFFEQPGLSSVVFCVFSLSLEPDLALDHSAYRGPSLFHSVYIGNNTPFKWKPKLRGTGLFFRALGHFETSGFFGGWMCLLARKGTLSDWCYHLSQGWRRKPKCRPVWFMKGCPSREMLKIVHCLWLTMEIVVKAHLTLLISSEFSPSLL